MKTEPGLAPGPVTQICAGHSTANWRPNGNNAGSRSCTSHGPNKASTRLGAFIKVAWNQQLSTAWVRRGEGSFTKSGGWLMPNSWGRGLNRSRSRSIDFDVPQCCYLNFYCQVVFLSIASRTHTGTHTQTMSIKILPCSSSNFLIHLESANDASHRKHTHTHTHTVSFKPKCA